MDIISTWIGCQGP